MNSCQVLNNRIFCKQRQVSPWLLRVHGKCYTYQYLYLPQITNYLLCVKQHLVPNGIAPNCWCWTTYLLNAVSVDTNCEPSCPPWVCGQCTVGNYSYGRDFLNWRSVPHPICETTVTSQYSCWETDHWPWYIKPPWWSLQCCVTPYPQYRIIHPAMMTCDVGMVIDGGRSLEMFLQPFSNSPCRFPYVLLITLPPVTLTSVYYTTLLCDVILILRGHLEAFNGITSLEMDLDPHFATNVLETSV